jgi:D-alanyl-D-alanine carboxypeptidase
MLAQVLGGLIVAWLAGAPVQTAGDKVDDYVRQQMKQRGMPGLSLAVVHHGTVVKAQGYGVASLELSVPASPESVYEIGSISKQFTAEAVMLLVEEGKIDLEAPLTTYVSDLPAAWSAITVRHVLTHTSGLKDWETDIGFSYHVNYAPRDFIALLAKYPLDFAPGTRWSYTSSGVPFLGLAIAKVSGRPYTDFVTDRIFKPLGMAATRFKHNGDIVPNRADGYMPDGDRLRRGEPLRPDIIAPNGGILTTVLDMARWDAAFFGGRLVRPESMAKMREPVRVSDGQTYTHGFALFMDRFNGHRMAFHPGTTVAGYSAVFYHFPDDELGVIVMTNLNDGAFGVDAMAHRIADFYVPGVWFNSLTSQPDADPKATQAIVTMLRDLAEGRDPSGLAPNLRAARISDARRKTVASHAKEQTAFVFLGEEPRTADHWILAPGVARIRRYRMLTGAKTAHYSFQLTADGQVAQFSIVENP